jgi:hypothetical protein
MARLVDVQSPPLPIVSDLGDGFGHVDLCDGHWAARRAVAARDLNPALERYGGPDARDWSIAHEVSARSWAPLWKVPKWEIQRCAIWCENSLFFVETSLFTPHNSLLSCVGNFVACH